MALGPASRVSNSPTSINAAHAYAPYGIANSQITFRMRIGRDL
jgi:hypothetical protein